MMSAPRYLAQRALTREWLHTELPITVEQGPSYVLSGSGSFRGSLEPEIGGLDAPDGLPILDEWGTFLFEEQDGVIRWGGIVTASAFNQDRQAWEVEAVEFSAYPHGEPYEGAAFRRSSIDPAQAFRQVWALVQDRPDADLGVKVTGASGFSASSR